MKSLESMTREVFEVNNEKGWHQGTRSFAHDIALLHTEVSEAYEAYRVRGFERYTDDDGKPDDIGSELADVFIRLLDTCGRCGIDLYVEYERKMAYNRTRSYRHGGKLV